MASCRKGTGVSPAADCGGVRTSFTVVMVYSVFVGTALCEFSHLLNSDGRQNGAHESTTSPHRISLLVDFPAVSGRSYVSVSLSEIHAQQELVLTSGGFVASWHPACAARHHEKHPADIVRNQCTE